MMELSSLTAVSPIDGRYGRHSAPLRALFSEFGLIRHRVVVELCWLEALVDCEQITELRPLDPEARARLRSIGERFGLEDAQRVKEIESQTNHDVKAVEYFLRERLDCDRVLRETSPFIHFACTSEDINNLAYSSMLVAAREQLVLPTLDELIETVRTLASRHADDAMLSRTHGQSASPTTLGKELAVFAHRMARQRDQIAAVSVLGKINGAVGNYNAHLIAYPDVDWPSLARGVVQKLGLEFNPCTTQIEPHDCIAELSHALMRGNTVLLDMCRDLWAYIALGYFRQRTVAGEIGSSTMPHKVNPIDFENAEGNIGLANALLDHLATKLPVSRWQRDLSDSTVLRNIGVALSHTMIAYRSIAKGLGKLEADPARLSADLDDAWEVLAEAVQTVMRRHGLPDAYEQLKAFSRGRHIDAAAMREFVSGLDLPRDSRQRLLGLTPHTYTGLAARLAREPGQRNA